MSQLVPITPQPGVFANGTEYSRKGCWVDSNLIRWVEGVARPIGGWQKILNTQLSGTIIAIYPYELNNGILCLAIGTTNKVYLYNGTLYDITPSGFVPPSAQAGAGYGWGADVYGNSTYGTARTTTGLAVPAWQYFFDSWGQTLVFCCNSDGKIYTADGTGAQATVIANAPVSCSAILVTDERFLVAIGAGGVYNRVSWCDREDYATWTATATSLAGGLNLNSGSPLVTAVKWRGTYLLYSMSGVHVMSHKGAPYVYGTSKLTDSASPISPRAILSFPQGITWLTEGGIMLYNGAVQPVDCPVWDTFRGQVNWNATGVIFCSHNSYNNELWWWFPTGTNTLPDSYIAWNYKENLWSIGQLARSAWADAGTWKYPIAATMDGYLVQHESNYLNASYNIGALTPYISTALTDVAYGSDLVMIDRLVPDEQYGASETLKYTLYGKSYPGSALVTYGPYSMSGGKIDVRATARQFKLRVDGMTDQDFSIGTIRARVVQRGIR